MLSFNLYGHGNIEVNGIGVNNRTAGQSELNTSHHHLEM